MTREEAKTALGDRNNLLWGMSKEEQKYYSEALDMAISALSKNKGEWIPVSERLPEKSGGYLIALNDRDFVEISWFYFDDKKWSYRNADVVAWAYMPEPYKEGGE